MALALFILMKEKNINIWKQKLDWIAEHGVMALMNTHPDYMNFDGGIRQRSDVRGQSSEGEGHPGEIRFAPHLREFHWVKKVRR